MVLTVGTLNRLRRVQDPHQKGRLLPLWRLLSATTPGGEGLGVPRAAPCGFGAWISPSQRNGAKRCSDHQHHRHHRVGPSASHAFSAPFVASLVNRGPAASSHVPLTMASSTVHSVLVPSLPMPEGGSSVPYPWRGPRKGHNTRMSRMPHPTNGLFITTHFCRVSSCRANMNFREFLFHALG
jgi:hypothetical protein